MRITGFCTSCHKVKTVRVSGRQLALARNGVVMGTCDACTDKERAR